MNDEAPGSRKVRVKPDQAGDLYEFNPGVKPNMKEQLSKTARRAVVASRRWSVRTIQQRWFERSILFLIVTGTLLLTLDSATLERDSLNEKAYAITMKGVLYVINVVFTVIFIAEMLIKMVP